MVPFDLQGKRFSLLFFPWSGEDAIAQMRLKRNMKAAESLRLSSILGYINWIIAITIAIMMG
jgi:hypothetical protein